MRSGFTLVEMVVSVGVTAILILIVAGVLTDTFKAKNRADVSDLVERNGNFVITELRRNIINSRGEMTVCSVGTGSSLAVYDRAGVETILVCNEGGSIASQSALGTVDLTTGVTASGCLAFVSCSTSPTTEVSGVNIGFTLSGGTFDAGPANWVEKSFETKVTVRN